MLNKELLMGNTRELRPVALTVDRKSSPILDGHAYGFDSGRFGALAPVPFWGGDLRLKALVFYSYYGYTQCKASDDKSHNIMVYISGYQNSPILIGETITGDIFKFEEKDNKTVYLTFDPPDGYLD